jgi:SAM-dependent methyltransferase
VLDVACGSGRHVRAALRAGLHVTGVDRDLGGVADLCGTPGLELMAADLEAGAPPPFTGRQFAGVIVTNYLWRPLLSAIITAVADDGVLIYETFAVGNEEFGRPKSPDFLLRPGELVSAVAGVLVAVGFEHVRLDGPPRIVQRMAAVGPAHRWLVEGGPAG